MKLWGDVFTAEIRAGKDARDAKSDAKYAVEMHDYYAIVLEARAARAGAGEG